MVALPGIFHSIFDCLALTFLWIVGAVTIIIPLSPIWITMLAIRTFENKIYRFLFNANIFNWEEVMWMDDLPKNQSVINCILLLKRDLGIRDFRNIVCKRLIYKENSRGQRLFPRVTKYICSGFVNEYWIEEKNFLASQHVYEWNNVPYDSKEDLKREMSVISSKPLKNNKRLSPWEFLLLHYKEDGDTKSAIIFRSHHSLADGASFVYLLLNQISDVKSRQVIPKRHSFDNTMLSTVKTWMYVPLVSAIQLMLPTPSHDLHCARVSEKKTVSWSEPISLPLIKSIKDNLGVSINDIVVGCFATNLYNFFKSNDKIIPTEIMASLSVNANSSLDEAKQCSNKFAVISVPIPTAGGDILQNVLDISLRMNNIKLFNVPNSYRTGFCVYDSCLPRFANKMLRNFIARKSSLVLTNVPGPQKPVKLGGVDVDMICFWPPQKSNIGMACTIFSYLDTITIGLSCDKALNINPYDLLEGLPGVLNDLADRIGVPREKEEDVEEDYDEVYDEVDDEDKSQPCSRIKNILLQQGVSKKQINMKRKT